MHWHEILSWLVLLIVTHLNVLSRLLCQGDGPPGPSQQLRKLWALLLHVITGERVIMTNESSLINNNVTFFQFCGTLKKMMGVRRSTSSTDITLATRLTRLEVVLDRMIWNFLFRCHTLDEGHFLLSICSMQTCCSVDYIGKYPITLIHGRSKGEALALKSSKNLSTFLGPRGPHGIPLSVS